MSNTIVNTLTNFVNTIHESVESLCINLLKQGPIPQHIGLIMDGNRRFAKQHQISTPEGHYLGFNSLERILDCCLRLGVKAVTAYAFSIENFKRPKEEVEALMTLAKDRLEFFCTQSEMIKKHEVSIRVIGKLSLLSKDVLKVIYKAMKETEHYNKAILTICFPYTSTDEMNQMISKNHPNNEITIEQIEASLYTSELPKLDILIRTSGEIRLSDFLLWQTSMHHTQIYFINVLWPNFSIYHLLPIILKYQIQPVIRKIET
ncbi:Di-trans-poly-cis-decaprenylcistransferase [Neoconidiobolus thromboides FSU 785]|nr:Di-trans-poly-cis-decaprenylcistransferase [Neoconidiobolus thromboides FSU 785]